VLRYISGDSFNARDEAETLIIHLSSLPRAPDPHRASSTLCSMIDMQMSIRTCAKDGFLDAYGRWDRRWDRGGFEQLFVYLAT
jgi:hypothetical protein